MTVKSEAYMSQRFRKCSGPVLFKSNHCHRVSKFESTGLKSELLGAVTESTTSFSASKNCNSEDETY